MSKFLTDLDVTLLDDSANNGRGSWRVDKPLEYASDVAGQTIAVPEMFITDFSSVPRLPVAYLLAGDRAHKASVVHDYLYRTGMLPRDLSDRVFREAACVSGAPWWCCVLLYLGVRVGGWRYYKSGGCPSR